MDTLRHSRSYDKLFRWLRINVLELPSSREVALKPWKAFSAHAIKLLNDKQNVMVSCVESLCQV